MSMENFSDAIGNRPRDLPACSALPQPTAPPRAPHKILLYSNSVRKFQIMRILRFWQPCSWGFLSSSMWRRVTGLSQPEFVKERNAFICIAILGPKVLCSSETSGTRYPVTQRHIPDEWNTNRASSRKLENGLSWMLLATGPKTKQRERLTKYFHKLKIYL
jgi:hypothetical protein